MTTRDNDKMKIKTKHTKPKSKRNLITKFQNQTGYLSTGKVGIVAIVAVPPTHTDRLKH